MANMVLKAPTNKVGSTCECDLGVTEEEWNEMSEDELIQETLGNIVNVWTEAV